MTETDPHKYLTLQVDERTKIVTGDCSCGEWSARSARDVFARFQVHGITNDWLNHRLGRTSEPTERDRTQ